MLETSLLKMQAGVLMSLRISVRLEKLLAVREHAYAMLGCGHPSEWCACNSLFISLCSETPAEGYRVPSVKEAEEADRLAMTEFFHLLHKGNKADDALHTIVKERDCLRRLLFCPPKAAKDIRGGKGGGKGKERELLPCKGANKHTTSGQEQPPDKRFKRALCDAFQSGKCKFGPDCKLIHRCEVCFESDHGSSSCKKKS